MKPHAPEFERNLGFLTVEEQERINSSVVAVAGAGGDGGLLALQFARLGVGEIRLADPDPFEAENINRQAACTTETVNVNKAVAVGDYINKINPDIKVVTYTDGITGDNVEEFVRGSNLLVDETEFTIHAIGTMLAREARKNDIANLQALNIGFGTQVTSYHPKGRKFEEVLGLDPDAPIDEIAEQDVPLTRWLARVPKYADMVVFEKIAKGEISAPSVAPGVAVAAGIGATQGVLHLVGDGNKREKPVYAPKVIYMDAMNPELKIIRYPRAAITKSLISLALNNKLGRNPKTAYSA